MRVLQLISSAGFYGSENMLLNLARSLPATGWNPVVGVFHNSHHESTAVADELRARGVQVETIPCRGKVDLSTFTQIRRCIEKHGSDLLHTHGYKANIYGFFAARRAKLPVVSTCHGWGSKKAYMRLYYALDGAVLRGFSKVAAVSSPTARRLRQLGVPDSKVEVIGNGIDVDRFLNPLPTLASEINAPGKLKIGIVGRVVAEKGHEYLLRAVQELANPNLLIVIVGSGPGEALIGQRAAQLGISDRVILCGHRTDMPGVYASLDIVVLPSLTEGMPMTILEAMAAGKPVIATEVGAVAELVISGRTGLRVRAGAVEPLRAALAQLVSNPSMRSMLGSNGQRWVRERFSASWMAKNYAKLYESVLHRTGAVAAAS
jgi:glycosyltransferase involved in cell wall biosynthesis